MITVTIYVVGKTNPGRATSEIIGTDLADLTASGILCRIIPGLTEKQNIIGSSRGTGSERSERGIGRGIFR
jgi:hypothetical protein